MHEQSEPPQTTSDDRITRALPYLVGLLVAFGLLIYNSTQGGSGNGEVASPETAVADAGGRRVPIADVRRALVAAEYDDVDVGEYAGSIILTGSVADDATRRAAGAAADDAAGGTPVDNRLVIADLGESNGDGADASGVPVTAAAATVPATAMVTTMPPPTTAATTIAAPPTTAVAGPETAAVPETTVAPAPDSAAPEPAGPVSETSAPAPPPEPSAEELNARLSELLKASPVQFEKLASRIEPSSFATLDQAVAVILSSTTTRLEVQGHTDSGGQPSFNQRLSEQRANSVRTYLVDHGVTADRLVAVGYGETRPVARNATPEGRSLNRRVEIVVIP